MKTSIFRVSSLTTFDYTGDLPFCSPVTNNTIKEYPFDFFDQCWFSDAMKTISDPRIQILPTQFFEVEVTSDQPFIAIVGKSETYDKSTIGAWAEGYILDPAQTDKIIEFVEKRKQLKTVIKSARNEILRYFPKDTLKINIFQDPEEKQGKMELVIYIVTTLDSEMALRLLDDFDDNWWLDKSQGIEDELCIHLLTI
ncbi:MAG TPA: hypothetical protein ENN05_02500 [Deltaproteobacteria bacterium]|nr:hypothetical protein [Deltaproteobacteria bacterium]